VEPYFRIKDLEVGFRTFEGLKNVISLESLRIQKGETFGLVGESGAGKSVLAYSILHLLQSPPAVIRGGEVSLNGDNLLNKSEREMRAVRGRRIAMIFQDPMSSLNPVFSVGQQLRNVIRKNRRLSGQELDNAVLHMLNLVQLPDPLETARKYPHELSGGQRQRVIIALALSCNPEFLIADEPTRNLDVTIQAGILKLIAELQRKLGVTILYIANNPALVASVCTKMGVIHCGRLIETGTVQEVVGNPLHPYTALLLKGASVEGGLQMRTAAAAAAQDWAESMGCRFVAQCPYSVEPCHTSVAKLEAVNGEHLVACHQVSMKGS
jgi:oligopeptide/dipeptide ABC transporter ATP-binding protein